MLSVVVFVIWSIQNFIPCDFGYFANLSLNSSFMSISSKSTDSTKFLDYLNSKIGSILSSLKYGCFKFLKHTSSIYALDIPFSQLKRLRKNTFVEFFRRLQNFRYSTPNAVLYGGVANLCMEFSSHIWGGSTRSVLSLRVKSRFFVVNSPNFTDFLQSLLIF